VANSWERIFSNGSFLSIINHVYFDYYGRPRTGDHGFGDLGSSNRKEEDGQWVSRAQLLKYWTGIVDADNIEKVGIIHV
jgi:hypothetical protein